MVGNRESNHCFFLEKGAWLPLPSMVGNEAPSPGSCTLSLASSLSWVGSQADKCVHAPAGAESNT